MPLAPWTLNNHTDLFKFHLQNISCPFFFFHLLLVFFFLFCRSIYTHSICKMCFFVSNVRMPQRKRRTSKHAYTIYSTASQLYSSIVSRIANEEWDNRLYLFYDRIFCTRSLDENEHTRLRTFEFKLDKRKYSDLRGNETSKWQVYWSLIHSCALP